MITAIRFDPSFLPEEALVAVRDGHWAVRNELHQSWINLKEGDYIRIDDPKDTYPIDAAYMAANYDEVEEENTYANTQNDRA